MYITSNINLDPLTFISLFSFVAYSLDILLGSARLISNIMHIYSEVANLNFPFSISF